ncbi:hypothetical protein AB0O67_36955 [Streptomyces sp. NPDC086077]|uniref:hypothetical protein n=1 Tax=Streptomyces sp. NPDC086077 TaxID=3154862 RepID=UPI0034358B79
MESLFRACGAWLARRAAGGPDGAWAAPPRARWFSRARACVRRPATPFTVVRASAPAFLAFVLALGVVVRAVVDNGLAGALGHALPDGAPGADRHRRAGRPYGRLAALITAVVALWVSLPVVGVTPGQPGAGSPGWTSPASPV